jgi:formylglycine-generating enzyme required for sulfatase activity
MAQMLPRMIRMPSGAFQLGSSASEIGRVDNECLPQVVSIQRPFEIGAYAVTVDEFATFADATGYPTTVACTAWSDGTWVAWFGSFRSPGFEQSGSHPAVCVSWEDACRFTRWLSGETGEAYRLPTEAEWEYCARAGTTTRYWWGDDFDLARVNCRPVKGSGMQGAPVAVARYSPNPWGLYQVHGNVWEWVADPYASSRSTIDGSRRQSPAGGLRVLRGGSWNNGPHGVRSARRHGAAPDFRRSDVGFRVAKTLPACQEGSTES